MNEELADMLVREGYPKAVQADVVWIVWTTHDGQRWEIPVVGNTQAEAEERGLGPATGPYVIAVEVGK